MTLERFCLCCRLSSFVICQLENYLLEIVQLVPELFCLRMLRIWTWRWGVCSLHLSCAHHHNHSACRSRSAIRTFSCCSVLLATLVSKVALSWLIGHTSCCCVSDRLRGRQILLIAVQFLHTISSIVFISRGSEYIALFLGFGFSLSPVVLCAFCCVKLGV